MKVKKVNVIDDIFECQYSFYYYGGDRIEIINRTVKHYGHREVRGKFLVKCAKSFWESEILKREDF